MPAPNVVTARKPRRKPAGTPVPPSDVRGGPKTAPGMTPAAALGLPVDPDSKRSMIATAAYFRAEQRGFAPGHEVDDWLDAEASVEKLLHRRAPRRRRSSG
jgi:hypothetical protein